MPEAVVTGLGTAMSGVDGPAGLLDVAGPGGSDTPPVDPAARLTGRGLRYRDRATRLAMLAASDALAAARSPDPAGPTGDDFAVVVSSNLGNVDTVCETVDVIAAQNSAMTSPMTLPSAASNVIASWLAIRFGLRGPGLTFCNGPTSGLDAVHWARMLIRAGRASRVLVVGVEPGTPAARRLVPALFDGAVALVMEAATHDIIPLAGIGGYRRTARPETAVAAVGETGIGLWCAANPPAAAAALDVTARFGDCSGALGVLQCAAGVAWLSAGGVGDVVAVAGGGEPAGDDAAAALRLTPPAQDRS